MWVIRVVKIPPFFRRSPSYCCRKRALEAVRCRFWQGPRHTSYDWPGTAPHTDSDADAPTAPALFDPHHHRIRADQVFYTGLPEPDVVQPSTAVGTRIVEATLRPEQHVQAHQ